MPISPRQTGELVQPCRTLRFRNQIALVETKDKGNTLPMLLNQRSDLTVLLGRMVRTIDQPQQHVGVGNGLNGRLDHDLSQLVEGLVDPRRIHKHDLRAFKRQDSKDPSPRRLRFGRDDGHFLPDVGIHQRRLANVGSADDAHKTRTMVSRRRSIAQRAVRFRGRMTDCQVQLRSQGNISNE